MKTKKPFGMHSYVKSLFDQSIIYLDSEGHTSTAGLVASITDPKIESRARDIEGGTCNPSVGWLGKRWAANGRGDGHDTSLLAGEQREDKFIASAGAAWNSWLRQKTA
jgi:hypothetical protein